MSNCKLDHSLVDVKKKLLEQTPYIPGDLVNQLNVFLEKERTQQQLNELFHLLKKYDLSSEEVRNERMAKMRAMVKQ